MKTTLRFSLVAILLGTMVGGAGAQQLLSDFDDFASEDTSFLGTWTDNLEVPQFSQQSGYIRIEPAGVSGGNPEGNGSFQQNFGVTFDLNNFHSVSLTGRNVTGNQLSSFGVFFLDDESGVRSFRFDVADFNTLTFDTITLSTANAANYQDRNTASFKTASITAWGIEGDLTEPGSDFRFEFDSVSVVPEPSTYALMLLGGAALWFVRRRKA